MKSNHLTGTVEDYLKAVYAGTVENPERLMSMGLLARNLGLTAGTATTMVKRIAKQGLLKYQPRQGCELTELGLVEAKKILHKHRLLEFFLVKSLGMDWSEVHQEAEILEHALSDKLLGRLDAYLGHPPLDPHGKVIPRT